MRRRGIWIFVLVGLSLIASCNGIEKNKEIKSVFDSLATGDDRTVAITRMGVPSRGNYKNILGLSHETMVWGDGSAIYRVDLLNGKVVFKSYEQMADRRCHYGVK